MKHKRTHPLAGDQSMGIAALRIGFGLIWAIDAAFKWQPAFANQFVSYLTETYNGQPTIIQAWLDFWITLVSKDPLLFARSVAIIETAIAAGLILGLFNKLTTLGGSIFIFLVWAVPEGFGGPYASGSTDVGTGIIYIFAFLGLFLLSSGQHYGLDKILWSRLGKMQFLSSSPL